jgi:hypothetical protein
MGNAGDSGDLVWITEAVVTYNHSRNWFNRRITDGIFAKEQKVGETKVYLRRSQIERYMREHPEEDGQ